MTKPSAQEQDVTAPPDDLACKHGPLDEFGWCGRCHDEKVGENDAAIQAYEASISPQLGRLKVTPPQRRAFRAGYAAGIATLTAENKALREALREEVILYSKEYDDRLCNMCGESWGYGQPERHAHGCLAAGAANER